MLTKIEATKKLAKEIDELTRNHYLSKVEKFKRLNEALERYEQTKKDGNDNEAKQKGNA
jgi:mRNA-degrading endonuclease RelE of RelBE toxin-antitoxin system